jgi:hypothetical protein
MTAAGGVGANPIDVQLVNLKATSATGVVDVAATGPVNVVSVSAGDRVMFTATGAITGGPVTSTGAGASPDQTVTVASSGGGVNLTTVTGPSSINLSGQTGVTVPTVTSTGAVPDATNPANPTPTVNVTSAGGNINTTTVTAPAVAMNAAGNVSGGTLNVVSSVVLGGDTVNATVNGGTQPVGGAITGFNGGVASNVDVTLSAPGGFTLASLFTTTGQVSIPVGPISIDNVLITERATLSNPMTSILVDQTNRTIQGPDVQLYTGGSPFELSFSGNLVNTSGFVVFRNALHEVITPFNANESSTEQGGLALATVNGAQPAPKPPKTGGESGGLVSYTGVPVAIEGECPKGVEQGCAK